MRIAHSVRPIGVRIEFDSDPAEFLERAGVLLAAEPVRFSIVASVAAALRDGPARELPYRPWFATVSDGGTVVGVAMRTAPAPYPPWLSRMPAEVVPVIVDRLADDPSVTCAEGEEPSVREFAARLAERRGMTVEITRRTRLFEFLGERSDGTSLGEPTPPAPPPGRLRPATPADAELCVAWFEAFHADAAAQGGGDRNQLALPSANAIRRTVAAGRIHLWEVDGAPVHLTGHSAPSFGVARIAPVYTPEPLRGRGFAGAAVYRVSADLRAAGNRVCLYTDLANPTSNSVYQAVGYRPVGDNASVGLVAASG